MRSVTGWQSRRQVRLNVKTVPADTDRHALRIARRVAEWFRAAGVDAGVVPMAEQELLRQTLLRNEFELFVMRLPARFREPDALYTLLHSQFADAPGWQNPFGYANLTVDDLLETQRRTRGARRREAVERLQRSLARTQPFTLLAVQDDVRAVRTTAYANWREHTLRSPLGYLLLEPARDAATTDPTLRVAVTDPRPTMNLNPLSVEFRRNGVLTGLLYDPLGYGVDGEMRPWLAESWAFTDGAPPVARVRLRSDASWHDGEPLTATDVAFTYRLLADTTLGAADEPPVPSPRFHGRTSLVETVRRVDDATVEVRFTDVTPRVAVRAFSVPVLPRHVWGDRSAPASIGGVDFGPVTDALVANNIPPVGSGPLAFAQNTPRERLVLERFEDHFLNRPAGERGGGLPARVGGVPFDRLSVRVVGSDVTSVEVVASEDVDVTGTTVGSSTVPRIGRSEDLELLVDQSSTPYVLGYNARRPHLNNPRVRRTLARLIDSDHLAETVLDGYGRPAVSPLWGTRWLPADLAWSSEHSATAFLGSDGRVDPRRARDAFREAGYRYDDGRLVGGNT
jgi:peptide/nickel transport system substrate-binding protein